ncbi:MAG TPA: DUF6798 domain-containing protein [Terracidiphilus sp.]|nr:DUF6798 domain-containing protein [Terracidiphilus sp.]
MLCFTVLSFAVMGYHPGLEDDGIYLTAVKARLNPALYPYNADFFRLQMQATVFDGAMAWFVRVTGVPVAWAELFWQLASIFTILWACHSIARRLFREAAAQWSAVAMVGAMLTLPVTGTALLLVDQHLHPRTLATALILLAVAKVMEGKDKAAIVFLALAVLMHPIMAVFGISFCVFLALAMNDRVNERVEGLWPGKREIRSRIEAGGVRVGLLAAAPLGWVFAAGSSGWREALKAHTYYFIYKWTWYEWLGAVAPLALFCVLWLWARRRGETPLARFGLAVFAYGLFQQVVALVMLPPVGWLRMTPLQPMRYLHLVYVAMALVGGGLLGHFVLKKSVWRWVVCLALLNAGMLVSQEAQFPASRHLELPGVAPNDGWPCNDWIEAFDWIRQNTPTDAYFALDPHYLNEPGEDYHGFRALAERSSLADGVKDPAVVVQVPSLGVVWLRQVEAEKGWAQFGIGDFERLKQQFGVNWVVVSSPAPAGLNCRWHNRTVAVCQIP